MFMEIYLFKLGAHESTETDYESKAYVAEVTTAIMRRIPSTTDSIDLTELDHRYALRKRKNGIRTCKSLKEKGRCQLVKCQFCETLHFADLCCRYNDLRRLTHAPLPDLPFAEEPDQVGQSLSIIIHHR